MRGILSTVRKRVGDEEVVRILLDDHIHTVTVLVQRLNRDIEALQEQVRSRDDVTHRTQSALRSMEFQQLSVLSDLRSRVARCDDSIARLAADIRSINENIHRLSKEYQGSKTVMESKLKEMEIQVCLICSKAEQTNVQDKVRKTADNQVDTKLKAPPDEWKTQSWLRNEQDDMLKEVIDKIEWLCHLIKSKTTSNEKVILEKYSQLSEKLDKMDEVQKVNMVLKQKRSMEEIIDSRITKVQKQLGEEMKEMRAETNTGFAVIHESLGSLRQVLEAKMKLEREQLQRQIWLAHRGGHGAERKESQG